MVLDIIEFYKVLLWSPQPLFTTWAILRATVALFVPALFICWLAAIVVSRAFLDRRNELTAYVRAGLAWAWGCVLALIVVLLHVSLLTYSERIAAMSAAIPYYTIAALLAIIAIVRVLMLKRELNTWRQLVN